MRIIETEQWSPYPMGHNYTWRLKYAAIFDTETMYTYPEADARYTLALAKRVARIKKPKKTKK